MKGDCDSKRIIEMVYNDYWSPAVVMRYYSEDDTLKLMSYTFEKNIDAWQNQEPSRIITELARTFSESIHFSLQDSLKNKIEKYDLMNMPADSIHGEEDYSVLVNITMDEKSNSITRWVPHKRPQEQERHFTQFCKYLMNSQTI